MIGAYTEENEDGITELDVFRRGVARFTGVEMGTLFLACYKSLHAL